MAEENREKPQPCYSDVRVENRIRKWYEAGVPTTRPWWSLKLNTLKRWDILKVENKIIDSVCCCGNFYTGGSPHFLLCRVLSSSVIFNCLCWCCCFRYAQYSSNVFTTPPALCVCVCSTPSHKRQRTFSFTLFLNL